MDLAFLAPDVVEAVLHGEQRADATLKSLTVDGQLPMFLSDQRQLLLRAYVVNPTCADTDPVLVGATFEDRF